MNIVIAANCQATALASILKNVKNSNGANAFNVTFCKPVYELVQDECEFFLDCLAQADVLLYQPHKGGPKTPKWRTSDYWVETTTAKHCISFASLYFAGYNPELCYLRKPNGLHLNEGLVDYHDKRIVKLFLAGYSAEQIAEKVNQLQPQKIDVEENLQSTFEEMVTRESELNLLIKVSDFIKDNYKKYRLFYTYNHPANEVLYEVVRQLITLLGLKDVVINKAKAELLRYDDFPILPAVAKHLGLTFKAENKGFLVQNKPFTKKQLVKAYCNIYSKHTNIVEQAFNKLPKETWLNRKKLILHIGLSKTGTTSFQRFAFQHRAQLQQAGVYYPKVGVQTVNHVFVAQHYNGVKKNNALITELKAELNQQSCEHILISCEAFESLTEKNMKKFSEDFYEYDIYVLCSIRDRLSWLRSMYAEVVKKALYTGEFSTIVEKVQQQKPSGLTKFLSLTKGEITKVIDPNVNHILKKAFYYESLKTWQNEFLAERIMVCDIENESLWQKIATQFRLDLSFISQVAADKKSNISPSVLTIELVRLFYVEKQINHVPYAVASKFVVHLEKLIQQRQITNPYNSHFESESQLTNFVKRSVDDDMHMLRAFNINRSGYEKINNMTFINKEFVNNIYQDLIADIEVLFKKLSE